jgi:hypothetical protein
MSAGVGQYAFSNDKRPVGVFGGNVAQRWPVSRGVSVNAMLCADDETDRKSRYAHIAGLKLRARMP